MEMEKMIKIGNVVIYEKLCFVDFWVESKLGRTDITHNELYRLLDTCDKSKVSGTCGFVTFWHGQIEVTAFIKENATHGYLVKPEKITLL